MAGREPLNIQDFLGRRAVQVQAEAWAVYKPKAAVLVATLMGGNALVLIYMALITQMGSDEDKMKNLCGRFSGHRNGLYLAQMICFGSVISSIILGRAHITFEETEQGMVRSKNYINLSTFFFWTGIVSLSWAFLAVFANQISCKADAIFYIGVGVVVLVNILVIYVLASLRLYYLRPVEAVPEPNSEEGAENPEEGAENEVAWEDEEAAA